MKKSGKYAILFTLIIAIISFSPLSAESATVLDEANTVRFMYWLINGPPGGSYPSGFGGPDGGFLGMIRDITGPTALGLGLTNSGYSSCTAIPSSGSASMVDGGTFLMTFGTPAKTIPTGWTGAGTSYEKRVTVAFNGTTFMDIEFNCTTTTGWLRFFEPTKAQSAARNIEVYYDTTTASNTKLELYMYYEPNGGDTDMPNLINEYFIAKFATASGNKFNIWITRAAQEASKSGFRATIHGSTSLASGGLANAHMLMETGTYNDATTEVASNNNDLLNGDIDCVNFNSGGTASDGTTSCTTNGLTLSAGGAPISDSSGDFSINWVSDTTNGLKSKMTSLP